MNAEDPPLHPTPTKFTSIWPTVCFVCVQNHDVAVGVLRGQEQASKQKVWADDSFKDGL